MGHILEFYWKCILIVFIVGLCVPSVLYVLFLLSEPIINLEEDKTLVSSIGVQEFEQHYLYGSDLLFMLMNADSMMAYPRAIKINDSPVIRVDNEFLAYQINNVSKIYSASGEYKLSTMLDWKVTSTEYVYNDAGEEPYIKYTLEEVT